MKCKHCGQSKKWTEKIAKGIGQIIHYDDGYIVEEITTYEKNVGVAICGGCGAKHTKYEL